MSTNECIRLEDIMKYKIFISRTKFNLLGPDQKITIIDEYKSQVGSKTFIERFMEVFKDVRREYSEIQIDTIGALFAKLIYIAFVTFIVIPFTIVILLQWNWQMNRIIKQNPELYI